MKTSTKNNTEKKQNTPKNEKPKKTRKQIPEKNLKSRNFSGSHDVVIVFFSLGGFKKCRFSKSIQKESSFLSNNTSQRILVESITISFQR